MIEKILVYQPEFISPGNEIQVWSTIEWINSAVSILTKKKHEWQHWYKNKHQHQHHLDAFWPDDLAAADIMRNRLAISVKEGLAAGLGAQHCSISFLHSESQWFGIVGLNVLFTIPPV